MKLPKVEWTHEAHLVMGLWHLQKHSLDEALEVMAPRIKAHNDSVGTPNSDSEGYHETLTRFWLYLLAEFSAARWYECGEFQAVSALAKDFVIRAESAAAHTFDWYSPEQLFTTEARLNWVSPDRVPNLDQGKLETKRVLLRGYEVEDSYELFELLSRNQERLRLPFPQLMSLAVAPWAVELWIARTHFAWKESGRLALGAWCRQSRRLLGHLSILAIDRNRGQAELAYFLDQDSEGKGLATEFVQRGVDLCRQTLKLRRLGITAFPNNQASRKLAERLGFHYHKQTKANFQASDGRLLDSDHYLLELEDRTQHVPFSPTHFEDNEPGLGIAETFTKIYQRNHWGATSPSGLGAGSDQTMELRTRLASLFQEHQVNSVLDAPCGDASWVTELKIDSYVGVDIVEELIAKNRAQHPDRDFRCLDLAQDPLPEAQLILSRDLLVHLSFEDALRVVRNFVDSGAQWLLCTTFTDVCLNLDITTGDWRPLNLEREPFSLPQPTEILNENCSEADGRFQDKCLGLWPLAEVAKSIGGPFAHQRAKS